MKYLILLIILILSAVPIQAARVVMFPQPWRENGANLRDMINNPDRWSETRNGIDMIGYWPWLMHAYHSAEEQHLFFDLLKKWNIRFNLEVPVIKGHTWCGTLEPLPSAEKSFYFNMELEKEFRQNGMDKIDVYSFDEPLYASIAVLPQQAANGELAIDGYVLSDNNYKHLDYGINETAKYIALLRKHSPGSEIMDIEPYPAMSLDELKYSVRGLQTQCRKLKVRPPEYLRLDVDWAAMEAGLMKGSWNEVKELAEYCRSRNMKFSLIYWAAAKSRLDDRGFDFDMQWYTGIMHQGETVKLLNLEPDEYVVESWIHMPNKFGPEDDIHTYTGAMNEFIKNIVKK